MLMQGPLASVIFFFQPEDGIRDVAVTGVQTCALPIWADEAGDQVEERGLAGAVRPDDADQLAGSDGERDVMRRHDPAKALAQSLDLEQRTQIGRASCRERV